MFLVAPVVRDSAESLHRTGKPALVVELYKVVAMVRVGTLAWTGKGNQQVSRRVQEAAEVDLKHCADTWACLRAGMEVWYFVSMEEYLRDFDGFAYAVESPKLVV